MSQETIGQRLKVLISALGLDVKGFCQRLDIGEGTVRNYFSRGNNPNADFLTKLTITFDNVNLSWLLTGKGTMFLDETASQRINSTVSGEKNTVTNIGQSLGAVNIGHVSLDECKSQLTAALMKIDYLEGKQNDLAQVIAAKDALIASKDETLALWRIAHNRPN